MKDVYSIGEMLIDFIPGSEKASYIRKAGGARKAPHQGVSQEERTPPAQRTRQRRLRKHCTVFSSKQAIVIGPTPPGTGVIHEALGATDP